jgi:hypothetical protein
MSTSGRDRSEPELGHIEGLDPVDAHHRAGPVKPVRAARPRKAQHQRAQLWVLIALLLAAAALLFVQIDAGHFRVPVSQTQELLDAGARAESAGRWYGSETGDDALSIYRGILDRDLDNNVALLGLRRVGDRLDVEAGAAIEAGEFERAGELIELLASTGEAGDRVGALRQRLQSVRVAGDEMQVLLDRGKAALARGRIRGDEGALTAFKQMLARDPGSAVATRGVEDALQALVDEAMTAITAGRLEQARELAEAVAAEQPQHARLPALLQTLAEAEAAAVAARELADARAAAEAERVAQAQARFDAEGAAAAERQTRSEERAQAEAERQASDARDRLDREIAGGLARGDRALRRGQLGQAAQAYLDILAAHPDHAEAKAGLDRLGNTALDQAAMALDDRNAEAAAAILDIARRAQADPRRIERLAAELVELSAIDARPELDAAQAAQLQALLQRARDAEARGDLVEPVGDSAYDLFRQALRIDPMQDDARKAIDALPRRAQTMVVHHMEIGQLDLANRALDALTAMAPLDGSLPELRRQLASAWLEQGSRELRAGAATAAAQALEQARRLSPEHPGVAILARQLVDGG